MQMDSEKISLDVYRHGNPIVNDAYDRLMANMFLNKREDTPNTFTFVGVSPKAGTTTIAINSVVSLANANWKTILIDADFRKTKREKRLNDKIERGLTDYLRGAAGLDEIICRTSFENLFYISCGTALDNPVQLLCSQAFTNFVDRVKRDYDFVVFDSSAINAAVDAALLAKAVSNVVLVVKQDETRRPEYELALSQLEQTGSNLLGVVMNKISKEEYRRHLKNYNHFFKKGKGVVKK